MAKKKKIIPNTLEECFDELNKVIDAKLLKEISEEEFLIQNHHNTGAWIRNNWIRENDGNLRFISNWVDAGAKHIDDISSIILTSYYRWSIGADIKLDQQLSYYKNYWLVNRRPLPEDYPKGVKELTFYCQMSYKIEDYLDGCLHVNIQDNSAIYWVFDYFYGWKNAPKETIDRLMQAKYEDRFEMIELFYTE